MDPSLDSNFDLGTWASQNTPLTPGEITSDSSVGNTWGDIISSIGHTVTGIVAMQPQVNTPYGVYGVRSGTVQSASNTSMLFGFIVILIIAYFLFFRK